MARLPLSLLTAGLLFASATPALAANVFPYIPVEDSVNFGVHPWVARERLYDDSVSPYVRTEWYYLTHPDRSVTHALHPVFRTNYYAPPVDPNYARFIGRYRTEDRYTSWNAYVPQPADSPCDNFSYERPNYRVPPYAYTCEGRN
ncbi:hypothetical protein COU80_01405 [Candidatus Peregrinibacteria bacterium CG10_big_fil_rev_8_21_14_0_10_55_24]|nr:MAG: hypothetical protein COU80_01405 [Candidatus Peregrinibacteria bacterium CG10_big_fil_rev_8_21_14_0_10_55_24]